MHPIDKKFRQAGMFIVRKLWRFISFTVKKVYTVSIVTIAIVLSIFFGLGGGLIGSMDPEDVGTQDFIKDTEKVEYSFHAGDEDADTRIARLNLTGQIAEEAMPPNIFLGNTQVISGSKVKKTLQKLAEDKEINGVLVELTTPGGSPVGSEMIAEGIEDYQDQTDQTVVVHINSLSASGGLWASVPARHIMARDIAQVGSLGVAGRSLATVENPQSYVGPEFIGEGDIELEQLSIGDFKAPENPLNLTQQEKEEFFFRPAQDLYDRFVSHVSEHRDMEEEVLRDDLGARIFVGEKAKEVNYVDTLGNKHDALQYIYDEVNEGAEALVLDATLRQTPENFFEGLLMTYREPQVSQTEKERLIQSLSICSQDMQPLLSYGNSIQEFCTRYQE